jgi:DNA-binding NtrC family response regulator/pSer/pThr/pTyr-binding forkhead associated (FHA) protein
VYCFRELVRQPPSSITTRTPATARGEKRVTNVERVTPRYRLSGEVGGVVRSYPLDTALTHIGRVRENEIVLPVRGVSRQHARLVLAPEGLLFEDLGSKNGTIVNGQRVQRTLLRPGDELALGPVTLRLELVPKGDAELAIKVGSGPDTTTAPRFADTTEVIEGGPGLALVESFLACVGTRPEPDLGRAIATVKQGVGARGACLFEATDGDAVVLATSGNLSDLPPGTLQQLAARPVRESRSGPTLQSADHAFAVLTGGAGERLGLVVWGDLPRGSELEQLLHILLVLADRFRPRPLQGIDAGPSRDAPLLAFPEHYFAGESPAMRSLYAQMRALVGGDLPVLLLGETGVGKDQLARILHASSPRRSGPYVAVNCAAIPAELLEAEMFGIGEKIATGVAARPGKFQLAARGTLFLDEIGDMPLELQAKLLRALQEKEIQPVGGAPVPVDIRVVAATNTDLDRRIAEGRFRRDLYYRVAGFVLRVPPLRERRDDIAALIENFLRAFSRQAKKAVRGITVKALAALVDYSWPGNIRELEHEIRRLVYLCPSGQAVESTMLSERITRPSGPGERAAEEVPLSLELETSLERLERRLIGEALARTGGNRTAAAKLLRVSRNGLAIKMERLGITEGAEGEGAEGGIPKLPL